MIGCVFNGVTGIIMRIAAKSNKAANQTNKQSKTKQTEQKTRHYRIGIMLTRLPWGHDTALRL